MTKIENVKVRRCKVVAEELPRGIVRESSTGFDGSSPLNYSLPLISGGIFFPWIVNIGMI
jgi:hypothetical protein